MIRRPPRSTRKESSAASDVYKRQKYESATINYMVLQGGADSHRENHTITTRGKMQYHEARWWVLLYQAQLFTAVVWAPCLSNFTASRRIIPIPWDAERTSGGRVSDPPRAPLGRTTAELDGWRMRNFPQPDQLKPETLLNRINSNRAPAQRQYVCIAKTKN